MPLSLRKVGRAKQIMGLVIAPFLYAGCDWFGIMEQDFFAKMIYRSLPYGFRAFCGAAWHRGAKHFFGGPHWNGPIPCLLYTSAGDCTLSLLREGAAYAFLLHRVLAGRMGAGDFTLYFAAVSGFSLYLGTFLAQAHALGRLNLSFSHLHEFLFYPCLLYTSRCV